MRVIRSDRVLQDEAGMREAVQAYGGEMFGFACRALDDRQLAEEVVQETFVRAWRAADRYDPAIASLRSWLFAILRNVIVDVARARRARPGLAEPVDAPVEDRLDAMLGSWLVEEALRRLTADHRHAVVAVHYHGRSAADVADELGVPAATIRTRLFYGLKALRLALDELGWDRD